jgi:hypothetical protein
MMRVATILYVITVASFLVALLAYAIHFMSGGNFALDLPIK